MPFSNQLKQLVELHRAAELAMKDLIIRLWPAEAIPSSYFGLVKRLVSACPRLDAVKRSVCIEGARMAFARVKVVTPTMRLYLPRVEARLRGITALWYCRKKGYLHTIPCNE